MKFWDPQFPDYGIMILVEMHRNKIGQHGTKVPELTTTTLILKHLKISWIKIMQFLDVGNYLFLLQHPIQWEQREALSSQAGESDYEASELILCSIKAENFTWTNTMHIDGTM